MRKYMLMFLLLCLHGLARGQTEGYSCYYWFDNDHASLRKVTSSSDHWQLMADASGLSESLHTIHLLVRDGEGWQSIPMTKLFMHTSELTDQSVAYYWFDNQQGKPMTSPMLQGSFDVDASALADGIHTFHYLVAKNDGSISTPTISYFVKLPKADTTMKGYYWFDTETEVHEVAVTNGMFEVDASALSDGFHRFHYQALHSNGSTSVPSSRFFLKTAQVNANDKLNCICSVDGQLRHIEKLSQQGGIIHWDLDMHDLTDGLHRIQLQTVTPSGAMSGSYTSYFMRVTTPEELGEMRCVYAIDNDAFNTNASVVSSNGSYHVDLDLSELSDGLHHISYMLYNNRGTNTKIQTRFFLKVPLGGNSINQYQYWLNDEGIESAKTVTLSQRVNPLQLMSLLPVESRPLRSSLFHFDTSSGKPMVYAKNTIHLRFYDAAMRFTDAAKDYADYNVSQEVNVLKTLESGVRETTAWPEENEIKWYQVTAERGDSLRFKLDHAATLQLFAPSGKEVYNVSGVESVSWGGLHAAENGTFYLALHDVTATQGEGISIDYEHIDKYAVLRQDVSVVGNGGFSTITFEGNGFDELTAVDLVLSNNIITSTEIGHEGNATTSVKFDFNEAILGQYKAVFHFAEGELLVEQCVKVEEAVDIALDISVSYASQFLLGTSNKYHFKVHNKGNSTAYKVPLAVFVYSPDSVSLTKIGIDGYDLYADFKAYYGEQFTEEMAVEAENNIKTSQDMFFFQKYYNTDYVKGHPYLYWQIINPDIRPKTDEVFTIELKTTQSSYLYMGIPDEWKILMLRNRPNPRRDSGSNPSGCAKQRFGQPSKDDMALFPEIYGSGCNPPGDSQEANGNPVKSLDPNDLFGYTAESGSHAVKDGLTDVYYRIEFENDPAFATASAHEIVVTDTLDATKFDLSTFAPTRVKIGEKEAELTGDKNFVTTIDMRPEINAIAQVEGTFDEQKGIAKWHISSLDPMTMEPTDDVMQGVLPVNYNGSGIGELMFDISLKPGLAHGTEINNRAGIVFDKNDVIMTPTWTNTIDRVTPVSSVSDVEIVNDTTAVVSIEAMDDGSGPWRYDVYVQYGQGASWWKAATDVPADTTAAVRIYKGIDHGFCVVATDMAGNVEQKTMEREYSLVVQSIPCDVNGDGNVNGGDIMAIYNMMASGVTLPNGDVNGDGHVNGGDIMTIYSVMAGKGN